MNPSTCQNDNNNGHVNHLCTRKLFCLARRSKSKEEGFFDEQMSEDHDL